MNTATRSLLLVLALALGLASPAMAQETPVVQAVLFYSPTCPHCQIVIQDVLPPLVQTYSPEARLVLYPPGEENAQSWPELALICDGQLELLLVNTSTERGNALFGAALEAFQVSEDRLGVPGLFVGGTHLIGSREIPELFPGLIEEGLAQGGVPWPELPGLPDALALLSTPAPTEASAPTQASPPVGGTAEPDPTAITPSNLILPSLPTPVPGPVGVLGRVLQDPVGNTLAIVVLIGMLISLVGVGLRLRAMTPVRPAAWQHWLVPVLALAGMGVAIYLSYVETTGDLAMCGPVGDCNAVQQSPYAKLFGFLPVGLVGLLGYLAILVAWLVGRLRSERLADNAAIALLGMTAFGTLFMVGLTFLEPFVIGATCLWCLSSAVIITCLLWLSVGPAIAALDRLEGPGEEGPGEEGGASQTASG
ncbi:MAG: hypothetical protein A2Y93_12990 [Chloroflexi bacterium RBG_13_68_17]|nr:MAG: hypothetical protein A2Y93_12990 [Chloroflexi bacterium RBG_13_68_17]